MRTTCVLALVASLLIMTGCTSMNGPGCGDHWGGFCDEGGCSSGCGVGGGFARPSFGLLRGGGGFGAGLQSAGCGNNGGTSASFSDCDCGPMCGAYLQESQTSAGCGCDECKVGQSYVAGQLGNWFGGARPRPIANSFNMMSSGVSGGLANMAGRFGGATYGAVGCDSGGCDSGGCDAGGVVPAGPCRGLGGMVGCRGCGDCSTNAVGTNHSACSTGACGPDGCGVAGGGDGGLSRRGPGLLGLFFRSNGSPHPYGGEVPHTASAEAGGFGGAAAPSAAYPYYTTRGPRDFLMMNPPSIGR